MDWKLFAQLLVTVIVALAGGWLGHHFAARRDLLNERRKLRVTYLLEAYRKLEDAGNRNDAARTWPQFESAIADIQLLGSLEQVGLARRFALDMAQHHTALLDPLVNDLRQSLRKEMQLQEVGEPVVYLRFGGSEAVRFDQTLSATIRNVDDAKIEGAEVVGPEARELLEGRQHIGGRIAKIVQAWSELEKLLRTRLEWMGVQGISGLGAAALLDVALETGAVTTVQHKSLRGLNVMRNLAVHGRDTEVDDERAQDFLALAEAMRVVLEITDRRGDRPNDEGRR